MQVKETAWKALLLKIEVEHILDLNSKEQNSSFSQITWKSISIGDLGLEAHLDPVPDTVREGEVVGHCFGALFLDV